MAAIARLHSFERGEGAVDVAEIADFGHAFEFVRRGVFDESEDAGHGNVDPNVDRPQLAFDAFGRGFHGFGIGDVALQDDGFAPARFDIALGACQGFTTTREKADVSAFCFRKHTRRGAAHARGGSGDHDDSRFLFLIHDVVRRRDLLRRRRSDADRTI